MKSSRFLNSLSLLIQNKTQDFKPPPLLEEAEPPCLLPVPGCRHPLLRLEVMDGVCWCCCLSVWLSVRLSSPAAAPATCPRHLSCRTGRTVWLPFLWSLHTAGGRRPPAADGKQQEAAAGLRPGREVQGTRVGVRLFIGCFRADRE